MLSKKLFEVVDYIYSMCDRQFLIPYKYDKKNRLLIEDSSLIRKFFWGLQTTVLVFQATYLAIRLALVMVDENARMEEKCRLVFILIVFMDQSVFELNLRNKKSEIAWLFNQCTQQTVTRGHLRKRSTKIEQFMLGWPIVHVIIFCGVMGGFFKDPNQKQYFISAIPEDYRSPLVFGLCAGWEAVANMAFIHICQFEFLFQTLVLRCQIDWTGECTKPPGSERDVNTTFRKYKELRLIQQTFNRCFSRNVEQIKSGMILVNVANNYVLIKRWAYLSAFMIADLIAAEIFANTLPPILYGNAYEIKDNSEKVQEVITRFLPRVESPVSRQYIKRKLRSFPPIDVRVAGMYCLDRQMTPRFAEIIITSTISLILSN